MRPKLLTAVTLIALACTGCAADPNVMSDLREQLAGTPEAIADYDHFKLDHSDHSTLAHPYIPAPSIAAPNDAPAPQLDPPTAATQNAPAFWIATTEIADEVVISAATRNTFQTAAIKFLNQGDTPLVIRRCLLNGEKPTYLATHLEKPDLFAERPQQFPLTLTPGQSAYFLVLGGHVEYTNPVTFIDLETDTGIIRCQVQTAPLAP